MLFLKLFTALAVLAADKPFVICETPTLRESRDFCKVPKAIWPSVISFFEVRCIDDCGKTYFDTLILHWDCEGQRVAPMPESYGTFKGVDSLARGAMGMGYYKKLIDCMDLRKADGEKSKLNGYFKRIDKRLEKNDLKLIRKGIDPFPEDERGIINEDKAVQKYLSRFLRKEYDQLRASAQRPKPGDPHFITEDDQIIKSEKTQSPPLIKNEKEPPIPHQIDTNGLSSLGVRRQNPVYRDFEIYIQHAMGEETPKSRLDFISIVDPATLGKESYRVRVDLQLGKEVPRSETKKQGNRVKAITLLRREILSEESYEDEPLKEIESEKLESEILKMISESGSQHLKRLKGDEESDGLKNFNDEDVPVLVTQILKGKNGGLLARTYQLKWGWEGGQPTFYLNKTIETAAWVVDDKKAAPASAAPAKKSKK